MPSSEERVDRVPWTKMMHLMVNRRPVPDKKASSVNETLNEGLATFALDRQESDICKPQQVLGHPPPWSYKNLEPDSAPSPRSFGEEAAWRVDFGLGVKNWASGDGNEGDGTDWSSSKKLVAGNRRHRRSASLDAPRLDTIRLGPTLTTSLSFKEPRNISPKPEKLMADDSTGKFAYISLDGRLINAELATSVTTIGGKLGDEEARAWEDFAPMQRILIVAVAAAAAAASKHRNVKEIDRLLKKVEHRVLRNRQHRTHRTISALSSFINIILSSLHTFFWTLVTTLGISSLWTLLRWAILVGRLKLLPYMMCSQEKELISLSQELNEICTHNNTGDSNANHLSRDYPKLLSSSPTTPDQQKLRVQGRGDLKANLNLQEGWSSTKNVPQPIMETSRSDLFTDEVRAKEEAKWYVNPMVETLQDSDEFSTPERCSSVFSACNPTVQGSFEWTALNSTGSRETDGTTGFLPLVDSPLTTSTQTTVSTSSFQTKSQMVVDDGPAHEERKPLQALCAAVVLDLRERILSVLDEEVSMIMAALDTSVKDAKMQTASMQLVIASCWNDSLPEALAALSLSPAEFGCFLNESQGTSPWNDSSKIEENIVAWRHYLENNYGGKAVPGGVEGKSPNKLKLGDENDITELVKELQSKEVEIADLKKCQKGLLESKNKELEELKGELESRDAELAAAETTNAASADRLGMLEELCREKDSTISDLKQDIQSLESKVQKFRVTQSPALPRGRRYSTSSTLSESSGDGTSQKQRSSDKYTPSDPGTDPILEHIGRLRKGVPSNKGHLRNLPHLNTQRHEDLTDDGRSEHGYDQETSLDYSSSTIGDDCSVNSHVHSETEVESRFGSENCSSGDDSRCLGSKDGLSGTKSSSCNRTLQKQKSMSSDLRRAVTSSANNVRSLTRTQSSKSYTSAISRAKSTTGDKNDTKPMHRTLSGEIKKVMKDPSSPGSCPGSSPRTSSMGNVLVNHRRSSSLDMDFKSNGPAPLETTASPGGSRHKGSPHSQDNSAMKRKRWV